MKWLLAFLLAIPAFAQPSNPVNGGGSSGVAPYLGLVGTRSNIATITTTSTWAMGRTASIARVSIPANGARPVFANMFVTTTGVEQNPGTTTYKMSIEYPSGVIAGVCTFGGQPTVTVSTMSLVIPDANSCPHAAIPAGSMYWVRALVQNAAGIPYTSGLQPNSFSFTFDGLMLGTGTPTDNTTSGTVVYSSGSVTNVQLPPVAIIGMTTSPSVCIVGDSRALGIKDQVTDINLDIGEIARSIGPVFNYTKIATSGITAFATATNFTTRELIVKYCSHAIDELGINDFGILGRNAAEVVASRSALAGIFGIPTFGTTLVPETGSSKSFVGFTTAESGFTMLTVTSAATCTSALTPCPITPGDSLGGTGLFGSIESQISGTTGGTGTYSCTSNTPVVASGTYGAVDHWSSTYAQQPIVSVDPFNTLVRQGIAGEMGMFDIDIVVDPLDLNLFPVGGPIVDATVAGIGVTLSLTNGSTSAQVVGHPEQLASASGGQFISCPAQGLATTVSAIESFQTGSIILSAAPTASSGSAVCTMTGFNETLDGVHESPYLLQAIARSGIIDTSRIFIK
jgi:hypothetical protein